MEIIYFSSPPRAGGFYCCNKPHDRTGYYVDLHEFNKFFAPIRDYLKERGITVSSKEASIEQLIYSHRRLWDMNLKLIKLKNKLRRKWFTRWMCKYLP